MSETHDISAAGVEALMVYLRQRGRSVSPSDNKTFDLIVDDVYAEVKAKRHPYAKFDFVGLTDNQYRALERGDRFHLFVVCNVDDPAHLEVFEIPSSELRTVKLKTECTHYLYRSQLDQLRRRSRSA